MKKQLSIVFVSLAALALAACSGTGAAIGTPGAGQEKGSAVFTVSDAAADMGAVSDIQLTVDGLRVRTEAGAWTTVDIDEQTYALLELRDRAAAVLLADVELEAGTYDRLELQLSEVVVVDAEGSHEATLPNETLEMEGTLEVIADATAAADFDFLADQSLHVTTEGEYVFAPVVLLETRSRAEVSVGADNVVDVDGGSVTTQVEIGMDADGSVGAGLRILPEAVLDVSSGVVVQTGGRAVITGTITAVDPVNGTVTLLTDAGTETVLVVDGDSEVSLAGSLLSGLLGLESQVGTRVNAEYDVSTGTVATLEADGDVEGNEGDGNEEPEDVEPGATVTAEGTVESVNPLAGTIVIVTDEGTELTLEVTSQTELLLDGAAASLVTLAAHAGSSVSVTFDAETSTATSISVQ